MFVCICNAIRDGALKALGREGVKCPRQAYEALGHAPRCGACLDTAHRILEDAQDADARRECAEALA